MRNVIPPKHGRYSRIIQHSHVTDGTTAQDTKRDDLLEELAGRMAAALIKMSRHGIQFVVNVLVIKGLGNKSHSGVGCHRLAGEGDMCLSLFENFTMASNSATFHIAPFW